MAKNIDVQTETTPLLPIPTARDESPNPTPYRRRSWQPTPHTIRLACMLMVLLVSLGDQWMDSPQTRIIENVICYRFYEDVDPSKLLLGRDEVGPGALGGIREMDCKVDVVQSELAMLRGWQQVLNGIPSLLLAVPMGWLADKYGRRLFLTLGLLAYIGQASWIQFVTWFWQLFDVRATWFSTIPASLGGGNTVTSALFFTVLSDVTPTDQRAGVFLRVGAFNLVANLIMPPIAAWLMEFNPWIPSLGGTGLEILSAALLSFIPETLNYRHPSLPTTQQPALRGESESADPGLPAGQESPMQHSARTWTQRLQPAVAFLTDDPRVLLLIMPFCVHTVIAANGQLILQYMSKRYGLTISKATLLLTIRNATIAILLFVLLPYVSTAITRRYRLSVQRKDLCLARISQVFLAVGWILVSISPSIPFMAISLAIVSLGQGYYLLLRSFLTSLVPSQQIARVYSVISVIDTVGIIVFSPLLAALFKRGLALKGGWIGLPFYMMGLVSVVVLVVMFCVGLRKGEDEKPEIEVMRE